MLIRNFLQKIRKFSQSSKYQKFSETISSLEKILGYRIDKPDYYLKALTHRSYTDVEEELNKSNERLEYLGDAVLDLVVGEFLFKTYPNKGEGFLTKTRSHLVDKQALADAAKRIGLEDLVYFKRNFLGDNLEGLKTIVSDSYEAITGAIYLDKGLKTAEKFLLRTLIEPNYKSGELIVDKNYKGQLLELTHSLKITPPVYKIADAEGPEHNKTFVAKVFIGDKEMGEGMGKSKKAAEQKAAFMALNYLRENQ